MLPDMMQSDLFSNFTSAEDVISLIYSNVSQTTDKPLEFHPCDIDSRNEHFNCTAEEYLRFYRGPQTLPLIIVLPNCEHRSLLIFVIVVNYVIAIAVVLCIPFFSVELCTGYGTTSVDLQTENVTILYVGVFIAGIVGNVIVCVVIIRHSSMHTATNYYLFSLAVSDLIYLMFGLPYDLSLFWYQYPFSLGLAFCKLRALISEASTYVSVLTIVAFSMERFLAICHPLHLYAMSGFKRAVRIIAALWVISFLSAVPFGVYSKIDYIYYPPGLDGRKILDSAFCAMLSNPPGFPLWEVSSLVFFAIPMAVMIILYGRMGLQIRFRSKHTSVLGVQQGSQHGESKQSQARKAIIRMLAAVVITFFVSWAPFHAQRLMFLYARDWPEFETLNTWLFSVAGLFYYFSCTINPILYNVMSHRYRVAFKETLCGKRRGFHKSNGFSREAQSSVRDSMISSTGGYDSHLVRMRSSRQSRIKDRDGNVNSTWTKTSLLKENIEEETSPTSDGPTTDVVVVIRNTGNGQPKCFTSNHNQHPTTNNIETSNLKDETCI